MYNAGTAYMNYISNSYIRTPKSKVIINNTEYTGLNHLVSYPKISHETTSMIGGFPAKTCEFEIYNRDGSLTLNGKEITVYRGLEINGTTTWIPMGLFAAEDADITNNINKRSISFKGTDRTRLFEKSFNFSNYTFATVGALIRAVCTFVGVTISGNIPFDNTTFPQEPNFGDTESCRSIISWIAEIGGCIAQITRDGKLAFTKPNNTGITIPKLKYKSFSKEPAFGAVDGISLGHASYDDAIIFPAIEEPECIWQINDNPIVENCREEWIEAVYDNVEGLSFIPFEITDLIDDFIFDLNDVVTVVDKNNVHTAVTILSINTSNRIKSNFKGETQSNEPVNRALAGSLASEISDTKKTLFEVDRRLGTITSMVTNADGTSKIEQLSNQITSKITSAQAESLIESKADSITMKVEQNYKNLFVNGAACFDGVQPGVSHISLSNSELSDDTTVPSGKARKFNFQVTDESSYTELYFHNINTMSSINELKTNTKYKVSFYAKSNTIRKKFSNSDVSHFVSSSPSVTFDNTSCENPVLSSSWQIYSIIFTTPASNAITDFWLDFYIQGVSINTDLDLYVSSVRLEEVEYATRAEFQVLSNQILSKVSNDTYNSFVSQEANRITAGIKNNLNGGICADFILDSSGATINNGKLTIKNENNEITINNGEIVTDRLKIKSRNVEFGITEENIMLDVDTAEDLRYSTINSNIRYKSIIESWEELNDFAEDLTEWIYPNDTSDNDELYNLHLFSNDSITIKRDCYYSFSFDYIAYTKNNNGLKKPGIYLLLTDLFNICEIDTFEPEYVRQSSTSHYLCCGTAKINMFGSKIIDSNNNDTLIGSSEFVGFPAIGIFDMDDTDHTIGFDDYRFICFRNIRFSSFEGSELTAGAIIGYDPEKCYIDLGNGAIKCEMLRAGRVETYFASWSDDNISKADRDIIKSDGGLVISANEGSNALILKASNIFNNSDNIYMKNIPSTNTTSGFKYLYYRESDGKIYRHA